MKIQPIFRTILYITGLIVVVSISIISIQNSSVVFSDSTCEMQKSDTMRDVLVSDLELQELWSIEGLPIENFDSKDLMISVTGSVILASTACDAVISLDSQSGDLNWKHLPENQDENFNYGDLHQPRNLTLDSSRRNIYVSATNEIRALSVDDGSMIWSNISNNFERNAHTVVIDEQGQLTVSARGSWYIHPETGELSEFPIDIASANIQPAVDSEAVKMVNETNAFYPISNIVIVDERVFVLDELARLHIFDRDSSIETHTIEFSIPEKTELLYEPGAIGGSWLAVDNDVIVVYFQDTDILSAYRILDEDFN